MPIGKNAIKRVANNGYSNTKTEAPDMENSVAIEEKKPVAKKPTTKKATTSTTPKKTVAPKAKSNAPKAKSAPKKSMDSEPELAPVKTLEKVVKKTTKKAQKQVGMHLSIGDELPIYLL